MSRTMRDAAAAAPPAAAPPSSRPPAGWTRALEFWLVSYRRTWRASVFSGFLAPLLYLGSLGYGLGSLIHGSGAGQVAGVAYAAFVAPGVLAANAMQTAVAESTYPVMGAVKWQRQCRAMIAAALTVGDVLLGHVAFILLRVLLGAAAFVAVGALLGAFATPWVLLTIPVAVLCGAVHALPVMGYAVGV